MRQTMHGARGHPRKNIVLVTGSKPGRHSRPRTSLAMRSAADSAQSKTPVSRVRRMAVAGWTGMRPSRRGPALRLLPTDTEVVMRLVIAGSALAGAADKTSVTLSGEAIMPHIDNTPPCGPSHRPSRNVGIPSPSKLHPPRGGRIVRAHRGHHEANQPRCPAAFGYLTTS